MKKLLLIIVCICISTYSFSQTITLLSSSGDGGFETGTTFASNNWIGANEGGNRQWQIGTGMSGYTGNRAAFIGNSSTNIGTNTQARITHLYRNLNIPNGATNIILSFKYKQTAVDNAFDFLTVFLNGNTPTYGTAETNGFLVKVAPSSSSPYSNFTTVTVTIPDTYAGSANNLIFTFNANNLSPHGYGGIDDVSISYSPPVPSNISISQTISPISAPTSCDQDYATLTASGGIINNSAIYSDNFASFTNWGYSGPNNRIIGAYFSSNNANGTSPEAGLMYNTGINSNSSWNFFPFNGTNLISFDSNNYTNLNINFKYMFDAYAGAYSRNIYLDVSTDNVTYTPVWSITGISSSIAATTASVNLNSYINVSTLYFRFRYSGDSFGINYWYVDDLVLSGTKQYPITWSPTANLFTNSGLTTSYTGGSAFTIYASPNGGEASYTATTGGAYPKTANSTVFANSKVFNGSVNNLWSDDNNWSPIGKPTLTKCIRVLNGKTVNVDITNAQTQYARVFSGGILNVNSGNSLTINDNLKNENANSNPNITVESTGNLIQNNNVSNTGYIIVKRNAKMKRLDYTYWSSPVDPQNLKTFSPNTVNNRFYTYNESNDLFSTIDPTTNNFIPAKGYAIRAPNNYTTSNTSYDWLFTGTPNNGTQTISVTKSGNGFNLVGNPYPSNISFSALKALNGSLLNYPVYFWTNSNANPPQQGSAYVPLNYATLTAIGGVAATNGTQTPTNTISSGQGFIVSAASAGTLTFNNSIRSNSTAEFFNTKNVNSVNDKFWLNLTSPENNINNILIGYIDGATNNFDQDYDAESIVDFSDKFYSILGNKQLIIQGREAPFYTEDIVPLGINFYETGNYTISLQNTEGVFGNQQAIYLHDKTNNSYTDLTKNPYSFNTNSGQNDTRFEITYKPGSTLGNDENTKDKGTIIYEFNNNIVFENSQEKILEIQAFDVSGKLINSYKPNDNNFTIEKTKLNKGVIVFKILLKNNMTTKKFLNK